MTDGGPAGAEPTAWALVRQRTVGRLLGAELLTNVAEGALTTALGWQAYARSGDPLVLGLLGLAEFLPALLLAIPAGHAADRYDRRRVAAYGEIAAVFVALGLALDAALGDTRTWPLYGFAMLAGCARAYAVSAFNPMLAAAVPPAQLSRVIALSSVTWQAGTIAGPALGGLLQTFGDPVPYVFAAAGAAGTAVLLLLLPRAVGTAHVDDPDAEATFGDALAGLRFIVERRPVLGAVSLDLIAVLLGGATALLPVFSSDILHVGAIGNGLLRAAPGVGATIVGLALAVRPIRERVGPTLFVAVALYGAFTVVFGLSRSFALSLAALAALAAADMVSVYIRGTLVPLLTPPGLRGRVGAVERTFIGASNELGAFESGVAAALVGATTAVVLGGALSIAVAALWAWWFPSLRAVDRFEDVLPPDSG